MNIEHVERICDAVEVPVQVGGGLRQADDVDAVLGGRRRPRDPRHRGALATRRWSRRWRPSTASGSSSRPTPAAGAVAVEGWERATDDHARPS